MDDLVTKKPLKEKKGVLSHNKFYGKVTIKESDYRKFKYEIKGDVITISES